MEHIDLIENPKLNLDNYLILDHVVKDLPPLISIIEKDSLGLVPNSLEMSIDNNVIKGAFIENIFIKDSDRHQGIGTFLFREAAKIAIHKFKVKIFYGRIINPALFKIRESLFNSNLYYDLDGNKLTVEEAREVLKTDPDRGIDVTSMGPKF